MITGKVGTGKSYATGLLCGSIFTDSQVDAYSFADVLKRIVVDLNGFYLNKTLDLGKMEVLKYKTDVHEGEFVYEPYEQSCIRRAVPYTVRRNLQYVGTDILRKHLGADLFVDVIIRKMDESNKEYQIISDLRFRNEYTRVKEWAELKGHKLIVIRMNRCSDETMRHIGDPLYTHISENDLSDLKDCIDVDNYGSPSELKEKLTSIILS